MQEFIEKLIGRLKKEQSKGIYDSDNVITVKDAYGKSISIANQLAEEYNNGFCEWHNGTSSIFKIKTKCGNSIDVNYGYEFCPYCGKKIKVVE